ncbi:MAG: DUF934 domain-containing protein [Pseudomonadota bacterium]
MRKIIKDREIVEDQWQTVDAEEALPEGDVIVPLARWLAEKEALIARTGNTGVLLQAGDGIDDITPDLVNIDLVAVEFPAFTDGRSSSYARLLRERHGYTKEIRAVGDVLRDQLALMARCGINAFVLHEKLDIEQVLETAFDDFSVYYQPAFQDNPEIAKAWQVGSRNVA